MKQFWKSKTLIANLVMVCLELVAGVGSVEITTLVNGVLRLVSHDKLSVDRATVQRLGMVILMFGFFTVSACAFQADGVAYKDEIRDITSDHIESLFDPSSSE